MDNFFIQHKEWFMIGGAFLIGVALPNAKVYFFGKKIGEKMPKELCKVLADRFDALEKGLRGMEYKGDINVVSNDQVTEEINKVKIDLGLDQK